MYDINKKLDEIIFKYNLDRYDPLYRKMYMAKEILSKLIEELSVLKISAVFIGEDETEVKILHHMSKKYPGIDAILYEEKSFESKKLSRYDKIYISSFSKIKECSILLEQRGIPYEWVYDIFSQNGITFERDFYKINHYDEEVEVIFEKIIWASRKGWKNSWQLELFYERKRYVDAQCDEIKQTALERCFFLAIVMKNFKYAEMCMEEMKKHGSCQNEYLEAWTEIQLLLEEIKKKLEERRQRDIIIYWLDSIAYGEERKMPYLSSRMEESICFTNAYTVTPSTNPTARVLFTGMKQVDDKAYNVKEITEDNSEVLRAIKEQGYEYKTISIYLWMLEQYFSDSFHEILDACSVLLWDVWQNLLSNEKPLVLLTQLLDIHAPFLCTQMKDIASIVTNDGKEPVMLEMDEQLAFYDRFISEKAVRIYMSDHGIIGFEKNFHVLLNVWENKKEARKINSLFSYIDFGKLLISILKKEDIVENRYARAYVEIQDVPLYNYQQIRNIRNGGRKFQISLLGYRGIMTKEHMYIKFSTEDEWIINRRDGKRVYVGKTVDDREKLHDLIEIVGQYPSEIWNDNKFYYSNQLRNSYLNWKRYFEELMDICLGEFADNSVAIRLGGRHSRELYMLLSPMAKQKICCFIDNNMCCECAEFGLPIVTLEEGMGQIKGVILSSFIYLQMLREEAKDYEKRVTVIDFYRELEQKGIVCENDFFDKPPLKEFWSE